MFKPDNLKVNESFVKFFLVPNHTASRLKDLTSDESWIFEYDPDTKRQSREWHTPNSPCPREQK